MRELRSTGRNLLTGSEIFDEEHFAYLEDLDIGYRARICGYQNWYAPKAKVYHVGSGTSGSRYNQFKIRYSSRNNIYLIYKNMPFLQIVLNLPFFWWDSVRRSCFLRPRDSDVSTLQASKTAFRSAAKTKSQIFHEESSALYTAPV